MKFSFSNPNNGGGFSIVILLLHAVMVLWAHGPCQAGTTRSDSHTRHISSYRNIDGAIQDVNSLKSKGHEAYFEKVLIPGKGVWYRVFVVKSPPLPRSRNLSEKRKTVMRAKGRPASNFPGHEAEKIQRSSIRTAPGVSGQGVQNASRQQRTGQTERAVLDTAEKKAEQPPRYKAGGKPDSVNTAINLSPPVSAGYEAAKVQFDAGRYVKAAAMLSSVISKKHNDAALQESSLRLLADCYYYLGGGGEGDYNSKGIDTYKYILQQYPDSRNGNDFAMFRLAKCLERAGSYEEAYTAYENVVRKYPNSSCEQDALYRMGEILYQTGRFTRAVEKLKYYMARYPEGRCAAPASFLIGYCLRQTGQQADGVLWYRNALNKWDNVEELPADVLYDLGMILFSWQDYSRAATLFSSYLNLYPEGALKKNALFHLGRSFYCLNRFSSALKVFSLLLENYPESVEANEGILFMANMGVMEPSLHFNVCMAGWNYFKNPIETYDDMRKKYPGGRLEEWLLYQKGYALWKAGRCKEAFDLYCHLLDEFSQGTLQKESRGYLILNAKRLIEEAYGRGDDLAVAAAYYKIRDKIPLSPETQVLYFKAGMSLRKLGFLSDAKAVWDSLGRDGRNASWQAAWELIAMEGGAVRQGVEIPAEKWNVLLRESAKNTSEITDAARRNLADYFYRKGQYDKAVPLYEALLKGKENSALLAIEGNYAHALKNKHECSSAMSRYLAIISKCRKNPQTCDDGFIAEVYAGLGDCYFETADFQRNIDASQQALPRLRDKNRQMWVLFRMAQSYQKIADTAMMEKTFSDLKERGDETFWPKVADYWVADQAWSKGNEKYLKRN